MASDDLTVAILFNDDHTLVAGEERDRLAVEGVDAVAATVADAVREAGWSEWRMAVGRVVAAGLARSEGPGVGAEGTEHAPAASAHAIASAALRVTGR